MFNYIDRAYLRTEKYGPLEVNCHPQETMQGENKPTAGFSNKGSHFGSFIYHLTNSWDVFAAKLEPKESGSQAKRIRA